jgi:hypothetical protein
MIPYFLDRVPTLHGSPIGNGPAARAGGVFGRIFAQVFANSAINVKLCGTDGMNPFSRKQARFRFDQFIEMKGLTRAKWTLIATRSRIDQRSARTSLLVSEVVSLPSTFASVEAGMVTILPSMMICAEPSAPTL